MKELYLLALSAIFGLSAIAQVSVTFQVNMNGQTVSPEGVHVAGDFQAAAGFAGDWDPATSELTDADLDGIYTLTVDLPVGQYEYKYVNGNAWGSDESVPNISKTGNSDNRFFVVTEYHADNGFVIPAVMYAGSAEANEVAIRLEVDMAAVEDISENGVHVAGSAGLFGEEWTPAFGAMFHGANSKYVYVTSVNPNESYAYKFINGNEWGEDEWAGIAAPDECTSDDNRIVDVADADVSVGTVCYEGCSTCAPLTEVTFRVNLTLEGGGSPEGVSVAGDFQGWSAGTTLMTDMGENIYEVTLMMEQGSYQFKFVNGGAWESIPGECDVGGNRGIDVGEDPITVEACFNQCSAECVSDPDPSDITFRVNMANETVSEGGVWVMGNFTSPQWQDGSIEMTDADGDGVYEVTVTEISGPAGVEFKFANGDPHTSEETGDFLTGGCGVDNGLGGFNRTLVRTGEPMVLDIVCYDACVNCDLVDNVEENVLGDVKIFPNPSNGLTYLDIQNPNGYT